MASVELREIKKSFGAVDVLRGVNLSIEDGEFVVFVGPSGCGKSTLLRIVAGLEHASSGAVFIDGTPCHDVSPKGRNIAMVFQSYALYPHMTVAQNIGFSLRIGRIDRATAAAEIERVARMLGLQDLLERRPSQLSGGQRQRVAMGRALVRRPNVFLLDEPLSNLDAELRASMRLELKALHQQTRTTAIYVTHDQIEAMTLADKIVVMLQGAIEQVGSPQDIFERPETIFVAGFMGSPRMNLISMPDAGNPWRASTIGVRPEDFYFSQDDDAYVGEVTLVEYFGSDVMTYVRTDVGVLSVRSISQSQLRIGERVGLKFDPKKAHPFDHCGRRI